VFFETLNRPSADVTVRQLVLAKAVDGIQLSLGHTALYPYVIQPQVSSGTQAIDVPLRWIWDLHASLPKKWENLRLAKIKRIAGENSTTSGFDGWLRCIFTANVQNSATEVSIFYADFEIDSDLTYQPVRMGVVDSLEATVPIDAGESETVAGFMIFRTLDTTLQEVQDFYNLLDPPSDVTDANGDGLYDSPAVYEIVDTVAGGPAVTDDFATVALAHGTGLLTDSAWSAIPQLDSDIQSWINSFNYPYDAQANRTSIDNITIPGGLFREFNITAPAGDQPTGDVSGLTYPVWVTRVERVGTGSQQLKFVFATFNVTDSDSDGAPSTALIEFASLDLIRSSVQGEIVDIVPIDNLQLETGADSSDFEQHLGRGHVVLSSLWDKTTSEIDDFFDEFDSIVDVPPDTQFSQSSTRLSSFGISRVPKYTPTIGQSQALVGSSSRRTTSLNPSFDNRYVTELDQGLGNQVDLEAEVTITPNTAIDRFGFQGALTHKVVKLVVDATGVGSDTAFYDDEVLPRLRILFGRDPTFGDFWYNGTRLMFHNGDTWQG
jgi:hypothetical protein